MVDSSSRAREILDQLQLVREQFSETLCIATKKRKDNCGEHTLHVTDNRNEVSSSRRKGNSTKGRKYGLRKLLSVVSKSSQETTKPRISESLGSNMTELTELTDSECDSQYSNQPDLARLLIEDKGQLSAVPESEENGQHLTMDISVPDPPFSDISSIISSEMDFTLEAETIKQATNASRPRTPRAASIVRKQKLLKKKIDEFFRNRAPFEERMATSRVTMIYRTSVDEEEFPSEMPCRVVEGRERLHELYLSDVIKLRQPSVILTATHYRSNRHERDQLNRVLLKTMNPPDRRVKTGELTHKQRREILSSLQNNVSATRKVYRKKSKRPLRSSNARTLSLESCETSQQVGCYTLLPSLSEESVDDFYVQVGGMSRTTSFCEAD